MNKDQDRPARMEDLSFQEKQYHLMIGEVESRHPQLSAPIPHNHADFTSTHILRNEL